MNIPCVCRQLSEPSPATLQQLQEIYDANFPLSERKPFTLLAEGLATGAYHGIVLESTAPSQEILACAFLLPLPVMPATLFLEYIAVRSDWQGKGLGSTLFREMTRHVAPASLVWEVEPPLSNDTDDERHRRIRFYQRLGGILLTNSLPYRMPDYETGSPAGVPLRLMQFPLDQQPDEAEVARLVQAIYTVAYKDHHALREVVLQAIHSLPD